MRNLIALALGILFALGLGVAGMTNPAKIIGFLDISGHWDPALMFVMGSAIPIYMVAWYSRRRRVPWLGGKVPALARRDLDAKLFIGASMFGVGWGLAGICPGPAVTLMGRPSAGAVAFLAAMVAGMFVFRMTDRPKPAARP
jgi:uncharacterized membrane protein YedE/YeeE